MADYGLTRFIKSGVRFLFESGSVAWFAVRANAAPPQIINVLTPVTMPVSSVDQLMVFNGTQAGGYQTAWINVPSGGGGGTLSDVTITVPSPLQVNKSGTTSQSFAVSFVNTTPQNQVLASPTGSTGTATMRSLVEADIPSLTTAKLSNFTTAVIAFRLDQFASPTANVNMNGQRLTGLAEPVNTQDGVTKNYVDIVAQGLSTKQSCRTASTANITIASPGSTIDGVTLNIGNRVLLKNQTTTTENGVYIFNGAAVTMTRSLDMDAPSEFPSAFLFVEEGTTNADTGWTCITNAPITIGTTPITFTQIGNAVTLIDGNGLVKTGNTLDVVGTLNRVLVGANSIDIDPNYAGQASITTLGTIATGTWNGTAIPVAFGGTGATTVKQATTNLETNRLRKSTFTNANLTSGKLTIAHNLDLNAPFIGSVLIVDNNGFLIAFPDNIQFINKDTVEIDMSFAGTITGTWTWAFLG